MTSLSRLSPFRILQIILLLAMLAVALWALPRLPESIPSHWSLDGTVDGWMSKQSIWLLPGIALLLSLLLPLLSRIDPKRENYEAFRVTWEAMQLLLVAFFGYVFCIQLLSALRPELAGDLGRWILAGVGVLLALMGASFTKLKPTYFIGIRTPWTLSDPEVWRRTHALASRIWMAGGALIVVQALLFPPVAFLWVFLALMFVMVLLPVIHSYLIYRALHR